MSRTVDPAPSQFEDDIRIKEEYIPPPPRQTYEAPRFGGRDSRFSDGDSRDRGPGRGRGRFCTESRGQRSDGVGNGRNGPDANAKTEVLVVPPKDVGKVTVRFSETDADSSGDQPIPFIDWARLISESGEEWEKRWASFASIIKNFYSEDPHIACMSREEVEAFSVCIYGGGSRREQIQTVNLGVEIVIATPGRLNDLVMDRIIDLNYVRFLVLDEADRMLDMGFEPQIKKVLLDIRPDRQTVMTRSTWPEGVCRLAWQYMTDPFQVFIGSLDLAAMHTVTQTIIMYDETEKRDQLKAFLATMQPEDKVIIFLDRKAMVDHLPSDFILEGINCDSIQRGREQCDREQALEDFRDGQVRMLIATDVAARGLDMRHRG